MTVVLGIAATELALWQVQTVSRVYLLETASVLVISMY